MDERRGNSRRSEDRRKQQHESYSGWDGIDRRSKRDRRTKSRRGERQHAYLETPQAIAKKEIKLSRREKERRVKDLKREGIERREFERRIVSED
ncbi:hypothetical protein K9N50_06960 [bacterium]|nr:hypothetical protein [bacterium]